MGTANSLKAKNRPYLAAYGGLHATAAAWVVLGSPVDPEAIGELAVVDWTKAAGTLVVTIGVMLLNGLGDRKLKASLVFWRRVHPEPGYRAFSEHAAADPRVDVEQLREALGGTLPQEPEKQNAAWIQLLRKHEADPAVRTNHGEYLLFRDLVWLSLVAATLGGTGTVLLTGISRASVIYLLVSLILLLLFTHVAASHGVRFVGTVMSCATPKREKAAGDSDED